MYKFCTFLPAFPFIFISLDPLKWVWERYEKHQIILSTHVFLLKENDIEIQIIIFLYCYVNLQ